MLEYLQTLFAPYTDGPYETHLCEIRCLPPRSFDKASSGEETLVTQSDVNHPPPIIGGLGGPLTPRSSTRPTANVVGGCRYFGLTRLENAAHYARAMGDTHDVYVGVLPRALPRTGGEGGRDTDIHEAGWLWADLDAHGASPTDMGAFLRRIHAHLPAPQMCALSGSGGTHLYWRLSEPFALTDAEARKRFAEVMHALVTAINLSGGGHTGIHADSSARNPSRILRVPGTWNHKRETPTPVRGILCAPADAKAFEHWENNLPCEPHPPARQRSHIVRISVRGARPGGDDTDYLPPRLHAWASQGYPEGQRHTKLTGAAAWLRRDTDLPEPLAHQIFHRKADASPGKHPLTEIELERIWHWA